ncbi:hypothetical protein K5X82_07835 [Halosquirtibacter xylanolyticus]|uniref:hypothetical protein n=1 Tax=Halosquirtibacter xylanolyticus TaxID=3374599 RepID=UPI00374905FA|nr:hypothetical protein K5X82_07835 [Prolixibacteraceae bacterium]
MRNKIIIVVFILFHVTLYANAQKSTRVFYVQLEKGKEIAAHPIKEYPQKTFQEKPLRLTYILT